MIAEKDALHSKWKQEKDKEKKKELYEELQEKQKVINDAVVIAKSKWYDGLADKIHDMNINPKLAWESIRIITGGKTTHHKKENVMSMKMVNGEYTGTDEEHIEIFGPHLVG